ncbi:MAG: PEP-CTERM sorting domain-containing protein [Rhizobiaceae bacterium]
MIRDPSAPVPEPGSLVLLATAISLAMAGQRRRVVRH